MCGLWVAAAAECCKLSSVGPSGGSLENQHQREMQIAEGGPAHEVSKVSPRSWARGHSSYIVAESTAFCLCSEKLCEVFESREP